MAITLNHTIVPARDKEADQLGVLGFEPSAASRDDGWSTS